MVRIIDTSVAIKWFVNEKGRDNALVLLNDLLKDPESFAVPELFYFELSHIFNRLIPNPRDTQLELFDQIINVGINRFSFTPELFKYLQKYQNMGLSGYDASYVALAQMLKGVWITFDKKAHSKIASHHLSQVLEL